MSKSFSGMSFGMETEDYNIVLNRNDSLVEKIISMQFDEDRSEERRVGKEC